jgi:hypothetical protein
MAAWIGRTIDVTTHRNARPGKPMIQRTVRAIDPVTHLAHRTGRVIARRHKVDPVFPAGEAVMTNGGNEGPKIRSNRSTVARDSSPIAVA